MSLDWNAKNVQFFKDNPDALWTTWEENGSEVSDVNAETKSLIFGSMAVGIGHFSEKNCAEWYARWKMYEKFDGFYLYSKFDGNEINHIYLTPDVLTKHINLSTNVGYESANDWVKRFVKRRPEEITLAEARGLLTYYKFEYKEFFKSTKED